jgi:hypothetical protein
MNGVTVYPVIGLPPFDIGAVQDTDADALPAVAVTAVGAPGAVAGATGVTLADAADDAPAPTAFVAVTVNVYAVPFVNPDTVVDVPVPVTVVGVCAVVPVNGVTTYPVIGLPPFDAGAVQDTDADALPAVAVTAVGAPGAVAGATGVTLADAADDAPTPTAFVAATVNVYAVPFVNPDTVVDVPVTTVAVCAVVPMNGVTVYPVIGLPPSEAGAVQDTNADALPAVAVTAVGEAGATGAVPETRVLKVISTK